jgi:hypothetical protein
MIANAAVRIISKAFIVQAADVYELILPWLLGQCEDYKKKLRSQKRQEPANLTHFTDMCFII